MSVLTVSLPSQEIVELFGPAPEGARLIAWDVASEPVEPETIGAVLIPDYFVDPHGFRHLRNLPNLKLIQLPSAGVEHAVPFLPPGVPLANGAGVHDAETAELAIGLAIASLRGIADAVLDAQHADWNPSTRPSLADRRVLLIGYGSIGHAIASRLDAFEVELTVVARTAREQDGRRVHGFDELRDLLPAAEIVILIAPLTEQTQGLVDARFLAALPDGATIVNVARGRIVDTEALLPELHSGRLHAALDVTDPEPLPSGHPLWEAPNTIVTPHVGGRTTATTPRVIALMRRQIAALLEGREPENLVRP